MCVSTSPGIVGQLNDLRMGGSFINSLNTAWESKADTEGKWGVIGAIDGDYDFDSGFANDSAGPGFVAISSSIPYGEWKEAIGDQMNKEATNTEHFGFRLAVNTSHVGLLSHGEVLKGIMWAVSE